jgi:N-acetylglutamate synthase-like GNAT family acetyltransferase
MRLRRAEAGDAEAIAALTRAAYGKWVARIGREPLPMRVDYAQALASHRFDVLEQEGSLVGLVETTRDGDWLLVVNLAVDPAAQGQGLGIRLLGFAERLAAEQELAGLRLYTNKLFVENIAFYRGRGFQIEREATLNGGVAVYMTKALARAGDQALPRVTR